MRGGGRRRTTAENAPLRVAFVERMGYNERNSDRIEDMPMRPDGTRVKNLPPIVAAVPYIMPKRYDAWNTITENIDEEVIKAYIREKRRSGIRINHMAVIIAAYYKAVQTNPKLNYFVMNSRIYKRNHFCVSFVILKKLADGSPDETTLKIYLEPTDTVFTIQQKISAVIAANSQTEQKNSTDKVMLNVALPKGRLGDKVYNLLAGIGYGCPEDYNATRKLVVENPAAGIRYFLVKPSDVAIYVEHGAADVGIVGKDILTEAAADVYELLDTGLGKCRMCVAAPADYQDDPGRPVRVATKFVNIAKAYYASQGRDIDIIKLNGSIELAPILGLSDVIVDIVETGTTLRENGLQVVTEFMPISARFIANKASYQFKHRQMDTMLEKLRDTLHKQEEEK